MKNPGWVDLQVNGHNGVNYSSPDLTADDFLRSCDELFAAGTEIFLPTIITAPDDVYRKNSRLIHQAVETHGLKKHIPGLHLEGPFLTSIGAHNPALAHIPAPGDVKKLYDMADGFITLLTLAADLPDEASTTAIKEALALGITPSVGHHTAGYNAIKSAADSGCKLLTHLGNACPNLVGRHENPLLAGLAEDRMTAMIITDGFHLPPELIRIICQIKGASEIVVTSDACCACGFPPGQYTIMGNDAVLDPCGRLYSPSKGCLVASVATMEQCMHFLESLDIFSESELIQVGRTNAMKAISLPC